MSKNHEFAHREIGPAYFVNAQQEFISSYVSAFQLYTPTTASIGIQAGDDEDLPGMVALAIEGQWRWAKESLSRAIPSRANGNYDVYAVAADASISNSPVPFSDNTNYAFDLQIVSQGATPTIVPGTVDIFRLIGSYTITANGIVALKTLVGPFSDVMPHASRHAQSGVDPLPSNAVVAATISDKQVQGRHLSATGLRAFSATTLGMSLTTAIVAGGARLPAVAENADPDSVYDGSTGVWRPGVAGLYQLEVNVNAPSTAVVIIKAEDTTVLWSLGSTLPTFSAVLRMSATSYLSLYYNATAAATVSVSWGAFLIGAT